MELCTVPKVSVIIPVYNSEKHLRQTLDSVLAQTLKEIEIICVNDGSSDGSGAILRDYAAKDSRVTVIDQQNSGAGAARNNGFRRATGKYLSFLDADDFFDPDMLKKAYERAEQDCAEIIVFGADFYDDKSGDYSPCNYSLRLNMLPEKRPFAAMDVEKNIFKTIIGWAWDKLFLRSFIEREGLTFQEQRTTNDAFFVFCAFAKAQRITTLQDVLVHQRRNDGGTLSVTREKSWMCFYNALSTIKDQLKEWGLFDRFECDFVNYALHFSLWNLNTLDRSTPAYKMIYDNLRAGWFADLGVTRLSEKNAYYKNEYSQYEFIMSHKFSALNLRLMDHRDEIKKIKKKLGRILGR